MVSASYLETAIETKRNGPTFLEQIFSHFKYSWENYNDQALRNASVQELLTTPMQKMEKKYKPIIANPKDNKLKTLNC
jgi:hypothetical protein